MNSPATPVHRLTSDRTAETTSYFGVATYAFTGAAILVSVLPDMPAIALLVAAALCGWSEADGLCGTSHICALTPLHRYDRRLWFRSVVGYTIGGLTTGALVGSFLGVAGFALAPSREFAIPTRVGLALLLTGRELGWLSFKLPEVPRQTDKMWAMRFGFPTGATMWGAHIGLAFATVINHGGVFVVALLAILLGPLPGSVLMAMYWLGRALPVWLSPACFRTNHLTSALDGWITNNPRCFRIAAATGLLCASLAASALLS